MSKSIGNYSFSFNQSLNSSDCGQIYNFLINDSVNKEIEILEEIDRLVEKGLTNPAADAIISKLTKED
tara:strand:+ start:4430 stop:4633 length:204 start_codon:yes stop_codon:yes gene_type:complete